MKINFNINAFERDGEWMSITRCSGFNNRVPRMVRCKITDISLLTKGQIKQQPNTEYFLHITSELPQLSVQLLTIENYDNDTSTYENLELTPKDRDKMLCELVKGLAR